MEANYGSRLGEFKFYLFRVSFLKGNSRNRIVRFDVSGESRGWWFTGCSTTRPLPKTGIVP